MVPGAVNCICFGDTIVLAGGLDEFIIAVFIGFDRKSSAWDIMTTRRMQDSTICFAEPNGSPAV